MIKTSSPLPKYRFDVSFETSLQNLSFLEITGLQIEKQIEHLGATTRLSSIVQNIFARRKPGKVILRNAIFPSDEVLKELYYQVKEEQIIKQHIAIKLLDENGRAVLTWILKNAWINKLVFSSLKSDANELADYQVEVFHDGIELDTHD